MYIEDNKNIVDDRNFHYLLTIYAKWTKYNDIRLNFKLLDIIVNDYDLKSNEIPNYLEILLKYCENH